MPFSSYGFLGLDSLPILPAEDVTFLELKGCLHIPEKSNLDELIRQYFLHIHPLLPVIDEAEFWMMYRGGHEWPQSNTMSLFVLQAMLSASCVVGSSSLSLSRHFETYQTTSTYQPESFEKQDSQTTALLEVHSIAELRWVSSKNNFPFCSYLLTR